MGRKPQWVEELNRELPAPKPECKATVLNPRGLNGHELIGKGQDFNAMRASDVCAFPPGSPEKIEMMRQRVARCELTTHPDDCDHYEGVAQVINHTRSRYHKDVPTLCKREEYVYHDPSELRATPDIQADDF